MNSDVIGLALAVILLSGMALVGVFCNRYHNGFAICALIALFIVSFVVYGYVDSFFAEPTWLKKADLHDYAPWAAAIVLPIYVSSIVSLLRLWRLKSRSLE